MVIPGGAALAGDLACFSISDVLQVLAWGQKTGALVVESECQHVLLYFDKGQVVGAEETGPCRRPLSEVLEKSGRLAPGQVQRIVRLRTENPRRVDSALVEMGVIPRPVFEQHLKLRVAEAAGHLFLLRTGRYRFDPRLQRPSDIPATSFSVETLILDGVRATDEWEVLGTKVPSLEAIPKWIKEPRQDSSKAGIPPANARVLKLANGRHTIRNIAELLLVNELDVARVVYNLLSQGMVKIIGVAPSPTPQVPVAVVTPDVPSRSEESPAPKGQRLISLDLPPAVYGPEEPSVPLNQSIPPESRMREIIDSLIEQAREASHIRQREAGRQINTVLETCRASVATPGPDDPQRDLADLVQGLIRCANELLVHHEAEQFSDAGLLSPEAQNELVKRLEEELMDVFARTKETFAAMGAVQVVERRLDATDLINTYGLISGATRSEFYGEAIQGISDLITRLLEYVLGSEITLTEIAEECSASWRLVDPLIASRVSRLFGVRRGERRQASGNPYFAW